ncbi:ribosome silencing factor [Luteibaculum oceani]|uniref:Ribosomal silencing factor RsfS n=1 Tax=Luteibaculum oceani TaxID=1294296 RepID=A0A5C6VBE9_9FLAO|nr:ribosome silencing factor [Luteibaculum oceani]TXC81746.1 ribosome silencing factor [Luteibaculum oceani]
MPDKEIKKLPAIVQSAIKGIQDVKGNDIVYINLSKLEHRCCDHFIVCHGNSNTQVSAIANAVEFETREELNLRPIHREGIANAEWALLDYGELVVHIFHRDKRLHYNIEELWSDGELLKIEDEVEV